MYMIWARINQADEITTRVLVGTKDKWGARILTD